MSLHIFESLWVRSSTSWQPLRLLRPEAHKESMACLCIDRYRLQVTISLVLKLFFVDYFIIANYWFFLIASYCLHLSTSSSSSFIQLILPSLLLLRLPFLSVGDFTVLQLKSAALGFSATELVHEASWRLGTFFVVSFTTPFSYFREHRRLSLIYWFSIQLTVKSSALKIFLLVSLCFQLQLFATIVRYIIPRLSDYFIGRQVWWCTMEHPGQSPLLSLKFCSASYFAVFVFLFRFFFTLCSVDPQELVSARVTRMIETL